MKKTLMAIFALALVTSVASAGVGINWSTGWGIYDHSAADLTGGDNPLLGGYSAIWQLIYAGADGAINEPDYNQIGGGNGDYVTGDDVVWAQREITQGGSIAADGTEWNNWMLQTDGPNPIYEDFGWDTAGAVYQRVFEGTPGPETWWGDTQLFTFSTGYAEGSQPDFFFLDDPDGNFGWQPTQQFPPPIPEPATLSLLGLGALALIRRKRS
jgi:hypothetical protein